MNHSIPVIDISADPSDVSRQWDCAFRRYGCCIIIGHEITEAELAAMKEQAESFFAQPLDEKMTFNYGPYGNEKGGYTPCAGEAVSQSKSQFSGQKKSAPAPDPVESFVLTSETHQLHTDILPISEIYFKKCEDLVHRLHVISTRALGIPEEDEVDYFRKFYCASDENAVGTGHSSFCLRLAHYPIQKQNCHQDGGGEVRKLEDADSRPRYGAHTDYMGYTVLKPDESDWSKAVEGAGGLEVFDSEVNCWIPVRVPDSIKKNALIVNAGDLLQRWTNDRWVSPIHRVSSPLPDSAAADMSRTALVYFSGPMADALITVCPACCKEGKEYLSGYEPVVALDYLRSKINPTILS